MLMEQKEFHNYDIRIASNGDWYHEGSKIKRFELVCKDFCWKKPEILKKFDKLIPNDEKDKN